MSTLFYRIPWPSQYRTLLRFGVLCCFWYGLLVSQCWAEPLTYNDFMGQVLRNHPQVQQARLDVDIASAQRLSKQGAFDPYISGYSLAQRFNSSSAVGKPQLALENDVTLTIPTAIGLQAIAGGKLALGDTKTPVSPTGDGGEYYWGVKLPLLRGFLMNEKIAAVKQAKIKEAMAAIQYREKLLALASKANTTYWQWATYWHQLSVSETLLSLAKERLDQIQQRVALGDEAEIVATEAASEVAKREGQLTKAQRLVREKALALGLFLWLEPTNKGEQVAIDQQLAVQDTQALVPHYSGKDVPLPPSEADLQADQSAALQLRPEPQRIGLAQTLAAVDKALATNNLLPQLDLTAIHGTETGNNSIGPVFKAGVALTIPLRYRTPLGDRREAQLSMDQLSIAAQQTAQSIHTAVTDMASEWDARYQQYQAAKQEYEAAEALAEGERTRFRLGDTTLFLVNQRERAAAEAHLKLIQYQNAVYEAEQTYYQTLGYLN